MESEERPILFQRLFLRLLGAEKYSPHGQSILDVGMRSGLRTKGNWLVPGLAISIAGLVLFAFRYNSAVFAEGFVTALGRVFIFDYLIFVLSWVSGWNMSYRWRKNADLIEEVALTDMRPRHLFLAQAGGIMAVWFYFLIVFAVFELLTITFVQVLVSEVPSVTTSEFILNLLGGLAIALLFAPPVVMLAWFHFESVSLAHRMFALGALPRIPLGPLAATNFVSITMHVIFLSMLGCIVTGVLMIPFAIVGAILENQFRFMDPELLLEIGWMYAALGGLFAVILAKRKIAQMYQEGFNGKWIAFQWWGAGELDHPAAYPQEFIRAARVWAFYHDAQEAEETPSIRAAGRQKTLMRYLLARKAMDESLALRKGANTSALAPPARLLTNRTTLEPAQMTPPAPVPIAVHDAGDVSPPSSPPDSLPDSPPDSSASSSSD